MPHNVSSHKQLHRHPPELRERATRMVFETIEQTGDRKRWHSLEELECAASPLLD